jgi:hypothetical protein
MIKKPSFNITVSFKIAKNSIILGSTNEIYMQIGACIYKLGVIHQQYIPKKKL